tara:strand:- start:3769 stop:5364 length:1596 start_codon:yes stop_codon:yes gene_type:complete
MAENTTLTIDGDKIAVPAGTTILQAAQSIGKEISHYCYHPGLSSPAMCRLCLVEVEGAPKLLPSCTTQVAQDQVVFTKSEKAQKMRTGVLEFYLANHPLDCPICDQSGECDLQDYVFAEGREHGRGHEPKRVLGRDDFGGDVLFYGDRCVMCTRCVRFMDEMEQNSLLAVVERGDRSVIDTFFESGLEEANWAGNVIDICPVGALVSKDFLHKARAWDLEHTPSICPNCSQGCNIDLHTRDNLVHRIKPRHNSEVNGHWICDYGRGNYEWLNRGDRVEAPMVRTTEQIEITSWNNAIESLAKCLEAKKGDVRAVVSPFWPNEDLFAVVNLLDVLGGGDVVYRSAKTEEELILPGFNGLARRRDLAPNVRGADLIGCSRVGDDYGRGGLEDVINHTGVILVLGDPLEEIPEDLEFKAETIVYLGAYISSVMNAADFILPVTTSIQQEGTFTNHNGRVQRLWPAVDILGAARPAWSVLGELTAILEGGHPSLSKVDQAFQALANRVSEYAGIAYEDLGDRGAQINDTISVMKD